MKRILASLAFAFISLQGPAATAAPGADPFNFLLLDSDARAVALGGAYAAVCHDANAPHYNPAGLASIDGHQVSVMHNEYFAGISQEVVGYASPWGLGAFLNYLDFGRTAQTTISNKSGSGLGSVGMDDIAASLAYGRAIEPWISVGLTEKYLRETIAGTLGAGFATDLGVLVTPPPTPFVTFGLALQNLGPGIRFQHDTEGLPLLLRLGAAWERAGALVTAEWDRERNGATDAALGFESRFIQQLPIRLGYSTRNDAGPGVTAGFGIRRDGAAFDYAVVPFGDLGLTHRLSASFRWGKPASRNTTANSAAFAP